MATGSCRGCRTIAWTRRFNQDNTPDLGVREKPGNATTVGAQAHVDGALVGETVRLAWHSPVTGKADGEIVGRLFTAAGDPILYTDQRNVGPSPGPRP